MNKHIVDEPLDIDLADINKKFDNTLVGNLGIRCTYVGTARVEGTMPVDHRTCQPFGYLHGGASLAFAETIAGVGTLALIPDDEIAVGQEVTGNHVGPAAVGDTVRGVATLLHKGRRSHLWNVDVLSQTDNRLISTIRVLNFILKKEKDS